MHASDEPHFPIAALCASAGGLEAFEAFFKAMPARSGTAFVVIQHLAPHRESILDHLLQRYTQLRVQLIRENTMVKPDNVYVLPAGYQVHLWNRELHLTPIEHRDGWPETIDRFLISLAEGHGAWAAALIFSGVGIDGRTGVQAVRQHGGLVIAQDPEQAAQSSMPESVIDAGLADMILPAEEMFAFLGTHFEVEVASGPAAGDLTDENIRRVTWRLKQETDHDFSEYKTSTLKRQIGRRMGIHQMHSIEDYLGYLEGSSSEADLLVKHLLINVTSFFRDPEAFEQLKQQALLPALSKHAPHTIFRVWVPGCATGEEAISIAILIYECLRELDTPGVEVRIFATDINRGLIQQAREGIYAPVAMEDVSSGRLRDHFLEEAQGYKVRNHISRMIVWSPHNLIAHPPFSSLHLISCRNVMIYFQRRLQERVMALFEFALQPEGILFLGSSETLPYPSDTFTVVDSKHKIYRRLGGRRSTGWLGFEQPFTLQVPDYLEQERMPEETNPQPPQQDPERQLIKDALIAHYDSTCAIVDERYQVRYTYGEIDRYLRVVAGREGQHSILEMAREGLDMELTIALHEAFEQDEPVIREGVWVKTNGDERLINLVLQPIRGSSQLDRRLVIFELVATGDDLRAIEEIGDVSEEGATIARLRDELRQTQKALQNATQALQAKSEELTTSMEEIRSANEEVQTTNEELRTSKEELESMNEELNTLNTQLTDQNQELSRANNTLHNFLQSTEIGLIFLDQDLAIREYTSAVTDIFGLRLSDVGRPLAEIANQLTYGGLLDDAVSVLDTLNNVEKEVRTTDGHWFNLRIRPYRTTNNVIDGLVLTFSDITAQKEAQTIAEQREIYVRQVFDTIENGLLELDGDLIVRNANESFYAMFQVSAEETVGRKLYDLGDGQWNIDDLRHLLTEIIPTQSTVRDFTVSHDFPDLGARTMRLNARQVEDLDRILLVISEVSDDA